MVASFDQEFSGIILCGAIPEFFIKKMMKFSGRKKINTL
jgi:hypothetical protein